MTRLLERGRELAALGELLERGGRTLVIEAGPGLGKSSLLEATAARARDHGMLVLTARGSQLEAEFAFGVVHQLLDRRKLHPSPVGRRALG